VSPGTSHWRSEHVIELDGEVDLAKFIDALTDRSNARAVGYTAQRLDKAVDAAVDRLLGPDDPPATPE
jgi:hypothetical protein